MLTCRAAITNRVTLPRGAKASAGTQIDMAWKLTSRKHGSAESDVIEPFFVLFNPKATAEVAIETDTVLSWWDDLPAIAGNRKRWEKVRQNIRVGSMPNEAYAQVALDILVKRWTFGMTFTFGEARATFEIHRGRTGASMVIGEIRAAHLNPFFDFNWHVIQAATERRLEECANS